MPAKLREAKERRPAFSREVLDLFRELEATPARQRKAPEFLAKSKKLAILLGLSNEWWAMLHVETANDLRPQSGTAAHDWWPRVRAMRRALLEALERGREVQPADEPAHLVP